MGVAGCKCWLHCGLLVVLCLRWACPSHILSDGGSDFVERCRADCDRQGNLLACGKYKAVRWLRDLAKTKEYSYGPLRLVRISLGGENYTESRVPRGSQTRGSKTTDTLNFVRALAEDMLTRRALVYTVEHSAGARSLQQQTRTLPTGPLLLDEEELAALESGRSDDDQRILFKKKKKSIVLPILVLLKLFKLKLLLLPIFFGVHFIKKFLVLGTLIAPSILAHLRFCKVPPASHQHQQSYPYHTWSTAAEAPADYPTGFGHEDAGWASRHDLSGHNSYQSYPGYAAAAHHSAVGPYAPYVSGYRRHYQDQRQLQLHQQHLQQQHQQQQSSALQSSV